MHTCIQTKKRANTAKNNVSHTTKQGAIITCLAKGGPAESDGGLRIGDTVEFVNDLHVPSLLKRVSEGWGRAVGVGRSDRVG